MSDDGKKSLVEELLDERGWEALPEKNEVYENIDWEDKELGLIYDG